MKLHTILYLLLIMLFLSCSDSGKVEPPDSKSEQKAKNLFAHADSLWTTGQKIKALKIYSNIASKYPNSKTKKIAEEKLSSLGLSINKPLISYTVQIMVEYENKIANYYQQHGTYPGSRTIDNPLDAWGERIYVEFYTTKEHYDFIIFSFGPDKKKKTEDDLAVIHAPEERVPVDKANLSEISTEDLSSIERIYNEETKSDDDSMTLDQLKQMGADKQDSSGEMDMSLEEFEKLGY